jgi:hypothetical protein
VSCISLPVPLIRRGRSLCSPQSPRCDYKSEGTPVDQQVHCGEVVHRSETCPVRQILSHLLSPVHQGPSRFLNSVHEVQSHLLSPVPNYRIRSSPWLMHCTVLSRPILSHAKNKVCRSHLSCPNLGVVRLGVFHLGGSIWGFHLGVSVYHLSSLERQGG